MDVRHRVDVFVHDKPGGDNTEILQAIAGLRRELMATVQEFADALAKVDAETTRIGDLIQQLTSQLGQGLTEPEEAQILAQLNAAGDRLKQVGNSVTNPVPTPTPDPNDPGNIPV